MPTYELEGSLEEQLATVYDMVQERMKEGRYTGALHYAKEIIKYDPNYRDIQELLRQAQKAQREQRLLLISSLVGAITAVIITRSAGLSQDWQSLVFGFLGLVAGFLLTNLAFRLRKS